MDNPNVSISSSSNYSSYMEVSKLGNIVQLSQNPISEMRAIKNASEIRAYKDAIRKTDFAMLDVVKWLNDSICSGEQVSEKDLSDKVLEMHKKYGAIDLSFPTIPAAAENSALIHYEEGDPNKIIKKGDFVLVDTGASYDSGLATDITRTWIAGGATTQATPRQKEVYTTVLKGSLNGLFAELPPDTTGFDLDAKIRGIITSQNPSYNYLHGTGHGIGIVDHEFPPSLSYRDRAKVQLKEGMVFSIEPGTYIEGFGGVRFENLVTVVKHHDPQKAAKGWHEIECLSFAPVDENLIEKSMLSEGELELLEKFNKKTAELLKEFAKIRK